MTTYAVPDPPPPSVDELWDAHGDRWERIDHTGWKLPGTRDEDGTDWEYLLVDFGPLTDLADRPPLCGHTWTGPTPVPRLRICPDGGPHTCHALAELHPSPRRHRCECGATTPREDDR